MVFKLAVCIVGHLRTSMLSVSLKALPFLRDGWQVDMHGVLFRQDQHFNGHPHTHCSTVRVASSFEIYNTSDCETFAQATQNKACESDIAWLQHAWIQHCFEHFDEQDYDVFLRIRPDSFFALTSVHTMVDRLRTERSATMITSIKNDSPQSDMLFLLNRQGLQEYRRNKLPRGCCSDYYSWKRMNVIQEIPLCLIRSENTLQCWMGTNQTGTLIAAYRTHLASVPCKHRNRCEARSFSCQNCFSVKLKPCGSDTISTRWYCTAVPSIFSCILILFVIVLVLCDC